MPRLVPALARGLDVLELFLDTPAALSAPDICAALGLPRTTVHELVKTLLARGYLRTADEQGYRYELGIRTFELGNLYRAHLDLAREGQRVAERIGARCQETVHVAIRDRTDVVYIAKVDSTHAVRMVSAVGHRLPAHLTAVGKVLLSDLPADALRALYPPGTTLPAMTPHSISSVGTLRTKLAEVAEAGVAYDYCESNPDVACVAAPVRDAGGELAAALSISVPVARWTNERCEQLTGLARDGAQALSNLLGHRPG
ncbi:MAG TPA: IclR family transcriptional regulator [Mycobacteriales bacterium]|jgi:DNA-binding IclR family transcriptional regulator|nr:IclR family transcriptional regulator [Mycobacteriales bacterium]